MNKYDQFSIIHLVTYLTAKKRLMGEIGSKADIISWAEMKEILEKSNLKNLTKEPQRGE